MVFRFTAMLLLALAATPALAGRPLQTEDAGLIPRGSCEVEAFSAARREPGSSQVSTRSFQFGCGLGASNQLALALSRDRQVGVSEQAARVGGKTRLWPDTGDMDPALGLAWSLGAARAQRESWQYAGADVALVLTVPMHGHSLHANIGHQRDELAGRAATRWAFAWEGAAADGWAPLAEMFGDDRAGASWNLGLRYAAVADKLFLDLSYGRRVWPGRPALWTAGFKWAF